MIRINVVVVVLVTSDPQSEVDVLFHEGDSVGVDGTKLRVLEDPNDVSLCSFLESLESLRFESEVRFDNVGDDTNFANESSTRDE